MEEENRLVMQILEFEYRDKSIIKPLFGKLRSSRVGWKQKKQKFSLEIYFTSSMISIENLIEEIKLLVTQS